GGQGDGKSHISRFERGRLQIDLPAQGHVVVLRGRSLRRGDKFGSQRLLLLWTERGKRGRRRVLVIDWLRWRWRNGRARWRRRRNILGQRSLRISGVIVNAGRPGDIVVLTRRSERNRDHLAVAWPAGEFRRQQRCENQHVGESFHRQ